MDLLQKSKTLGYILRHNSQDFDIELDKQGRARVQDILKVMNITEEELLDIVEYGEKTRYVIEGEYVRALHGHTQHFDIELKNFDNPGEIFHGTKVNTLHLIEEEGIKPMNLMFVPLSRTEQEAKIIADRKQGKTVVLTIDGDAFVKSGAQLFIADNGTIFAEYIPWEFVKYVAIL